MEVGDIVRCICACLFIVGLFVFLFTICRDQHKLLKRAYKKARIDAYLEYSNEEFQKLLLNAEINALAKGDESTVKELIDKKKQLSDIYWYLQKKSDLLSKK